MIVLVNLFISFILFLLICENRLVIFYLRVIFVL
jgi:hypothetical protein